VTIVIYKKIFFYKVQKENIEGIFIEYGMVSLATEEIIPTTSSIPLPKNLLLLFFPCKNSDFIEYKVDLTFLIPFEYFQNYSFDEVT